MNVLRFMAKCTGWMNTFVDSLNAIEAVEGEKPPSMLNTHVIALFDNGTSQTVWDVVDIETLPGGHSMVIRLATPPEAEEQVPEYDAATAEEERVTRLHEDAQEAQ